MRVVQRLGAVAVDAQDRFVHFPYTRIVDRRRSTEQATRRSQDIQSLLEGDLSLACVFELFIPPSVPMFSVSPGCVHPFP